MSDVNSTFGIGKQTAKSEDKNYDEPTASENTLSTICTLIIIIGTIVGSLLLIESVNLVNHSSAGGYRYLTYAVLVFGFAFVTYTILKVQLRILVALRKLNEKLK